MLWISPAILALWPGSGLSLWLRGGLGAFSLGKAALALFQLRGEAKGESIAVSAGRGIRAMALAYIAAGCIVGIGALWQRTFVGFLIAYAAFSFAWIWYWIRRGVGSQNSHNPSM